MEAIKLIPNSNRKNNVTKKTKKNPPDSGKDIVHACRCLLSLSSLTAGAYLISFFLGNRVTKPQYTEV